MLVERSALNVKNMLKYGANEPAEPARRQPAQSTPQPTPQPTTAPNDEIMADFYLPLAINGSGVYSNSQADSCCLNSPSTGNNESGSTLTQALCCPCDAVGQCMSATFHWLQQCDFKRVADGLCTCGQVCCEGCCKLVSGCG